MKRPLITTIALSLAALAIGAAAPAAVAAPLPSFTPVASVTIIEQEGLTVEIAEPTTTGGKATFAIGQTRHSARVKVSAGRSLDNGSETAAVGVTDAQDRLVIGLPAPAGGWKADTVYQWAAVGTELGADAYARGTFTTPRAWTSTPPDPSEPPHADPEHPMFLAKGTAPTSRTGTATIQVTDVYAGDKLAGALLAPQGGDGTIDRVYVTADSAGRALITLQPPAGGWEPETPYQWFVEDLDHGLSESGAFTTPAFPARSKPAPTKPAPPAPKPPKESHGGLSKTGA